MGNSTLGAMVYGGTDVEEIQLNEETFWSGSPHNNNSQTAREHLQEIRSLIFEGKEEEAHKILDKQFFPGPHGMRFLPLGSVRLSLGHKDAAQYYRELNLDDATTTTRYQYHGINYERTVFASLADNMIVVHLKASKKGALSFGISFDSQLPSQVTPVSVYGGNRQIHLLSAKVKGVEQEGIQAGLEAECKVLAHADAFNRALDSVFKQGRTMLNRFVSHLSLELGYFIQDFYTQQAKRTVTRNSAKFLKFRKVFQLAKILKELGVGAQIRFMLKELHDNDSPGAKRHKGKNPKNNHSYNIRLRNHLQDRYCIVQDNLQKFYKNIRTIL